MKKYIKPELFYEQFVLNTHIANCVWEHKNTYTEPAECTYTSDSDSDWGGIVVFTEEPRCGMPMDEGVLCYYTGADGFNTFNS